MNGQNYQYSVTPTRKLNCDRSLLTFILLNLVTCGIYGIVVMSSISDDINTIASRYDGRKTMHYCLLYFVVAVVTFGIGTLVWYNNISDRIGCELARRGINYSFGAADFWLWGILGSFIFVGPFVYQYKLFKAMNQIAADYNEKG